MPNGDLDPRIRLAYDESIRSWALQSSVLDELRGRAGVLLSGAALAVAFLGAKALDGKFTALTIAATSLFGAVVVLCLFVLRPVKWVFVRDAKWLINEYVGQTTTTDQMYRKVTIDNVAFRAKNDEKMKSRWRCFSLACFAMGADVILWLIDLGT